MKTYFIVSILILLTLLFKIQPTFASTLYFNDFTNNLNNYNQYFDFCNVSPTGLSFCNAGLSYNLQVSNLICISAEIGTPTDQSDIGFIDTPGSWIDNWIALFPTFLGKPALMTITQDNLHQSPVFAQFNTPSGVHNYMLCKNQDTYTGYIDNSSFASVTEANHHPTAWFINPKGSTFVTNFIASDSLPSIPTPTTTPTPTPSQFQLPVPLLKQTDPLWGGMEYDSAKKWAPTNPTIGNWGCALTSATMVMQYYGITKMPDGTPLNPASVNTWLKSQKDGYVGEGLLNWLALSRLSKITKNQNPNFTYDALEYRRQGNFSSSVLDTDLKNNRPDILEEPGHFVVGKGEDNSLFSINDPYYNRDSLSSYNNTALSLGRYIPSHTNLSYIEITLPTTLNAVLENSSDLKEGSDGTNNYSEITDGDYFLQNGIIDPTTNATSSAAKFLLVPTPQDGTYTLTLYSTTTQQLNSQIFMYDVEGNVTVDTLTGNIIANQPKTITFSYAHQPSSSKADRLCQIFQQHIPNEQVSDFLCSLIGTKM